MSRDENREEADSVINVFRFFTFSEKCGTFMSY